VAQICKTNRRHFDLYDRFFNRPDFVIVCGLGELFGGQRRQPLPLSLALNNYRDLVSLARVQSDLARDLTVRPDYFGLVINLLMDQLPGLCVEPSLNPFAPLALAPVV
jgi:hypothetical protein